MSLTSVRLNHEIEQPLEDLAQKLDRSKSYLINQAVKEFVARQAVEEQRWQETIEAIESVNNGEAVNEDDVNAWLNSWGTQEELKAPIK